jgi:DedD protein
MAFFKFRMPGRATASQAAAAAENAAAESAEVLRQRARHRLLGAAVLVVLAVIGFPFLFDTQPRTVSVDIAVEIPDKNKSRSPANPVEAAPTPAASPTPLPPEQGLSAKEEVVAPTAANAAKPAPVAPAVPVTSPPPPAKPEAAKVEAAKAEPDKPPTAEAKDGAARFVVQVGAYADADKAREVRRKLEKAGLKTYTHVAETKEGKRTRVRLGPFATRDEADKAADKAKQLEFTPAVLTL